MADETLLLLWSYLVLVGLLASLPPRLLAGTSTRPVLPVLAGLAAGAASWSPLATTAWPDAVPTAIAALCFGLQAGVVSALVAAVGSAMLLPEATFQAAGLLASGCLLGLAWRWGQDRLSSRMAWLALPGLGLTLSLAARAWNGQPPWAVLGGILLLGGGAKLVLGRAQAVNALGRHQTDLNAMLDASGGGRWEWFVQEQRLVCHGPVYGMLGIDTGGEGCPVQRWIALRHPDDTERLAAHLQRMVDGLEATFSAEYRMRDTGGRWRWIISRGQVRERDAHGKVLRMGGIHLDATALRQVQDAVRISEEQHSVVYQMLPDPACITRLEDGRCIDVNPAFSALFGVSRSAAVGRTSLELGLWPSAGAREEMLAVLRREGRVQRMPIQVQAAGTKAVSGLLSASRASIGGENCLVSVFQDLSAAQRAHDQLAAAHDMLAQAGRMAGLGVWKHRHGQGLVYWSDVCFDIHGLPRGGLPPEPAEYLRDFVAAPFRASLADLFRRGRQRSVGWSCEMQILRADDGRAVWVRIHAEPLLEGGAVTGLRGVMQDIDEWRRAAERLSQSEDRFMRIFELMPYPVLMSRRSDGAYLMVNEAWERLTGIPRGQALGRTAVELGLFSAEGRRQLLDAMSGRTVHNALEITIHTRNGGDRTLLQSMHAAELDGTPVWLVSAHDITERKRNEDLVREREALLSLTLSAASLGLWDWDISTGMVTGDARWRELQGMPDAAGQPVAEGVHWTSGMAPADIENVTDALERHIARPDTHFDATWQVAPSQAAAPGAPAGRWVRNLGKIVGHDERGRPGRMLGVCIDVTSQRVQEDMLQQLAHFDALTGLPNRVQLARRLEQAMAHARAGGWQLGVAYLDLDGFKPVNDRLGHSAGDRLLVIVAGRLTRALRAVDCVARLGGDEFVLLMPELQSHADAEQLLHRLMENLAAPYTLGTERVTVTASVGYTLYPEDASDADTLLRHADHAMYGAKQGGRNRVQPFDAVQERARQTLREQAERLREALARGQFMLYLQPKVDMRSGTVVGAEALARWIHPDKGIVTPGAFLHLIEAAELETAFGEWAVESALDLIEQLRASGLELPVSVNISARHLQQEGFAPWLAGRMARRPGIPHRLLDLEITESAALYDMDHVAPQLQQLRELGITISLDDFGTGYSSLSYLRRLPMDTLKLDRSFVHGMMSDRGDYAIVQGVIGLARSFGYSIVAEGVETEAQGLTLMRLGCTLAQGYCISRPMAPEAFPEWVAQWRAPETWRPPVVV
ncbi:EAL domain-containing protein [Paracidovorax citrulli]|uniref:Diguanylate cyclase/phosphodiesterase with PAS/PAC sensor(S) n=2 Tax=Paracidovorax citrulli TaxID=80869 RepID=A1TR06_PARC0|nr:EAL domain-containing protein [Paracidovorax citrulli]ABM33394.1 diguanylate cyclase/phosphodiesterase with PAS/PAC sensor(s) [Paracidovorax citrulli AAC00-1]ATG92687.1 GGDEF domain-containing protein [Paracidovorax citrulli]PVY62808.1 diguanylate cyclase/phosphodiesterase with PAS/PAC sensor(s) [Paracidovorax citrulli]REG68207.1 diguanylate cyclase/phosphodiesterase with PAS/PAC sensor(s) [Paracidovorax citrulli]RLJ92767.1 diguanylate cyclase/phosphodiesterase with PAS/PAC sensor(s) [Parac